MQGYKRVITFNYSHFVICWPHFLRHHCVSDYLTVVDITDLTLHQNLMHKDKKRWKKIYHAHCFICWRKKWDSNYWQCLLSQISSSTGIKSTLTLYRILFLSRSHLMRHWMTLKEASASVAVSDTSCKNDITDVVSRNKQRLLKYWCMLWITVLQQIWMTSCNPLCRITESTYFFKKKRSDYNGVSLPGYVPYGRLLKRTRCSW